MRRIRASVVLAVIALVAWPDRAEAYFWAWLDDLSGPRYMAVFGSFEFGCSYRTPVYTEAHRAWLVSDLTKQRGAMTTQQTQRLGATRQGLTSSQWQLAARLLKAAEDELNSQSDTAADTGADDAAAVPRLGGGPLTRTLFLKKQAAIAASSAFAGKADAALPELTTDELDNLVKAYVTYAGSRGRKRNTRFVPSWCAASLAERNRFYYTLDVGFAWDAKNADRGLGNSMFMTGVTWHWSPKSAFSVGTGAGIARFRTPKGKDPFFYRFYWEPVTADLRPFALVKAADLRNPWLHVFYLRGSVLFFPEGFDAGTFAGQRERFPGTEWTPTAGVYADLTPFFRKLRGTW